MKKMKQMITGFLTIFLFMAMILPVTTVKASAEKTAEKKCYTVTFRAGNVAVFDLDKINLPQGTEVTENYIKIKVTKGEKITSVVQNWETDAKLTAWFSNCLKYEKEAVYRLKNFSNVADNVISKNTEYVLDYERLIDPVSYTVSFIDRESKEQIATPKIVYGNAEETITVLPVEVADYTPTEGSKTLKLEKGKENTAKFEYNYTGHVDTITSTVTKVIPGTTRTETVVNEIEETVIVPGSAATPEFAANVADRTPAAGNQQQNAGGNAAANQPQNAAENRVEADVNVVEEAGNNPAEQTDDNENIDIDDEQTPLADRENDTVEIEESETPLANVPDTEQTSSAEVEKEDAALAAQELQTESASVAAPVIGAIVAVLVIGGIVFLVYKKKVKK